MTTTKATKVDRTEAEAMAPEIKARLASCVALVEADAARIDETLESLDGTPEEIFEGDTSVVQQMVEEVRVTARRSTRAAAQSKPPLNVKAGSR